MLLLLLLVVTVRGTGFKPLNNVVQLRSRNQEHAVPMEVGVSYLRDNTVETKLKSLHKGSEKLRYEDKCDSVCNDLPKNDKESVCMMFSRYKKGYQYFMNLCHARRAICKENLLLHMVHPGRCLSSNQYYMPVN